MFGNEPPPECDIEGSRADGETCGTDSQCQSRNCKVAVDTTCGTCAPRAAAGGSCTENDDCETGLICSADVCATPVALGGACTSSQQCAGFDVCKNGTCAAPAGAGQACDPQAADCDLLAGLFCDPASSTCKLIQIAAAGEACGFVDGTAVGCGAGGECVPPSSAQGTCAAPAGDGESCNAVSGPKCLEPAECVSGTCQLPNPTSCG